MKLRIFFILILCGCQTLGSDEEAKQQSELLNTQKSLIVSFLNRGMPSMALKDLRSLITQYPDDPDFSNLMGLTQLALGHAKMAIPHFEAAYKKEPRQAVALNLSSALIEAGDVEQAIKLLLTLTKAPEMKDYQHPERIQHNLGLASEKAKRFTDAEKYYKAALMENAEFYISLMRLGQLYERTKRAKLARSHYQRAVNVCKVCFDPVNALAMNHISEGKPLVAAKLLKFYLKNKEISPEDRLRALRISDMLQQAPTPHKPEVR